MKQSRKYKFVPLEEDFIFEEEVLHNPFNLKSWLRYIDFKYSAVSTQKSSSTSPNPSESPAVCTTDVDVVYERALRYLPGSYKLWNLYLTYRVNRAKTRNFLPQGQAIAAVISVFERSLVYMHKMPYIWLSFMKFLCSQGFITRARKVFDRSLQALPLPQHRILWRFWLDFVKTDPSVPPLTVITAYRRYVMLEPGEIEDLIEILVAEGYFAEAAVKLAKTVEDPLFVSKKGKSRQAMWMELCDILVKHPKETEICGLNADSIIRSGIQRQMLIQQETFEREKLKQQQQQRQKKSSTGGNMEIAPPSEQSKEEKKREKMKGSVGDLWAKLGEFYVRMSAFEKARDIYEEALEKVNTAADFSIIWDAYSQFEDQVIAQTMTNLQEEDEESELTEAERKEEKEGLELRMARYEMLLSRHDLLVNSVLLRQNPHNVYEWFKRIKLLRESARAKKDEKLSARLTVETYTEALRTIDPKKANGKPHMLWAAFAKFYDENEYYDQACKIFEKGLKQQFKCVDDLASLWCEYIEMEIRHAHGEKARELCKRATAKPSTDPKDQEELGPPSSAQRWIHRSIKMWSLYCDVEESFGTFQTTKAVYEYAINTLHVATPQLVLNYAQLLEEHGFYEESFKNYERGVELFNFPHSMPIWLTYLTKFVARFGGRKLERARDLFEQVLKKVDAENAKIFYVMYANLEEEYGLARHAMAVYDRATKEVAENDRYSMYLLYISRASEFFGVMKTRDIYERAISGDSNLPEKHLRDCSLKFAMLERKLGEIDRARAIYAHTAQFCNPNTEQKFWDVWREFEVQHGNDDTFREMLRVRRSVQASYNTQVNVAALEMLQAAQIAEKVKQEALIAKNKKNGSAMEQLEQRTNVEFTSSTTMKEEEKEEEGGRGGTANPEEMDIDDGSSGATKGKSAEVEEMPIPDAVYGGLKQPSNENEQKEAEQQQEPMGALERLRKAGKV